MSAAVAKSAGLARPASRASGGVPHRAAMGLWRAAQDAVVILCGFAIAQPLHGVLLETGVLRTPPKSMGMLVLSPMTLALVFTGITILVFWYRGLYRPQASVLNLREMESVLRGIVLASALFFAFMFVSKVGSFSRINILASISLATMLLVLERRAMAWLVRRNRLSGHAGRRVVIYGCNDVGRLLMKRLLEAPHLDCTLVGFVDDEALPGSVVSCRTEQIGASLFEARVLGRWAGFGEIAGEHGVNELLVALAQPDGERLQEVLALCRSRGIRVGVVPLMQELRVDRFAMEDLGAVPVLRPYAPAERPVYHLAKRVMDLTLASALLVLTAPIWIAALIAIPLDSHGPVLFIHERVGRRGRRFPLFKFRTMRTTADPYAFSPDGDVDPRITRVGRLLRMTGLDELPQLLNVLRGEMSLVGPRPEMPFIVDTYSELQRQRLLVKPGITGPWQLSADRHVQIHQNIEYDLYYLEHQSLMLDAVLLLETIFFTASLLPKLVRRSPARDLRPAADRAASEPLSAPYVLLALDQRQEALEGAAWGAFLPALFELSGAWQVRILVAPGNVAACDRLLQASIDRLGADHGQPRFATYRSRAELRALVLGARLVITDLPHVSAWCADTGTALLQVSENDARWTILPGEAGAIAQDLERLLRVDYPVRREGALEPAVAAQRTGSRSPRGGRTMEPGFTGA